MEGAKQKRCWGGTPWMLLAVACTVDDVVGQLEPGQVQPGNDAALNGGDAASDPCGSALFCSDFEQGLAAFDTQQTTGTLSIAPDGTAGSNALRASIDQASGAAYVRVNLDTLGITELFLRAYLWVPQGALLDDVAIFYLGLPPGTTGGINVDLQSEDRFELFLPENDVSIYSDPGAFQRDTWHCLQLSLIIDNALGQATLSIDAQSVASSMDLDTQADTDFTLFTLGIEWSSAQQGPVDVLLDDIVLSAEPVECL